MTYLAAILIIGLLIFVHEVGHLLAGWGTGIRVARFSIGFGPVVWSWRPPHDRRSETEYCLSAIPLGGYVLPAIESEEQFLAVPAWRRVVSAATAAGLPIPGLSASIAWYDTLRTRRGSADLIQAQRDLFGRHGFERVDAPGRAAHGEWS